MWEVLRRIVGQVRRAPLIVDGELRSGGVYGLDFGAVLAYAHGLGAPIALVCELLPDIEGILVRSANSEPEA